jgi:hypothetical protein
MTGRRTMSQSTSLGLAAILSGIAAIFCGAGTWAAETTTGDTPRIGDCRIGFADQFKVGFWTPIWVDVSGAPADAQLSIEVTTNDSDGVATTVSSPRASDSTLLYAKMGRIGSPIRIALESGNEVLDRRELATRIRPDSTHVVSLPSTSELIMQIGAESAGLPEAFPERESSDGTPARRVVRVDRVDRLPTEWYGYEGVDVLVLMTGDVEMCRQLAADPRRFAAIHRWVELGGRLIICCGINSPKLLGEAGALASLVPGKFAELVRLPQTHGLENFAESTAPIGRAGAELAIAMPRLTDVVDRVDVFGRGSELPVLVRAARGFGELVFIGLDLDRPPLADWPGRNAFWRAVLRPYIFSAEGETQPQRLTSLGFSDLSGALRQKLGRAFAGVTTITFSVVAALIVAYLLVLGPLDYFLIHKLLGQPMLAWVSFPVIVLLTCCGAAGLTRWSKGTEPHLNQAELVDFDLSTGRARGNYWSTLYSPQGDRYDLSLAPRFPGDRPAESPETLLSWFGLAGTGLGGMHAGGATLDIVRTGYRFGQHLDAMEGVPILTGATKSIAAQWTAAAAPPCSAELKVDEDGLLIGTLKNDSGATLVDACLLFGQWGYRLGDFGPGRQIEIGPALNPIHVKTLLSRRVRPSTSIEGGGPEKKSFVPDQATAGELIEAMMFYDALGGSGFVGLPNRYQAHCDLTRLLELGRAIVVAHGNCPGSQLVAGKSGQPLAASDDPSTIVYRVVFPIPSKP